MTAHYIARVHAQTQTRLWINNPTLDEARKAIAVGALGCTTNPGYCSILLDREPEYMLGVIDQVIAQTEDNDLAAELAYQTAIRRIAAEFLPLYKESGGKAGFAIIQGDPRHDSDPQYIVAEALRHRSIAENAMVKLPGNVAGAEAIDALVAENVPMCVTEIFGVGQAIYICEAHRRAVAKHGRRPEFYVTHITGILDRYLASVVAQTKQAFLPETLEIAGYLVAREEFRILRERGYEVHLMEGGAIAPVYFTRMLTGPIHVTTDWPIVEKLMADNAPIEDNLSKPVSESAIQELSEALLEFRRSYYADALTPADFPNYGPLNYFRDMFVQRYGRLVDTIASRRASRNG